MKKIVLRKDPSYLLIYSQEVKLQALEHYAKDGRIQCACCGCPFHEYLELDHIDGGGNKHRNTIGSHLARWLRKNNYPDGYQILCTICNRSKGGKSKCIYHEHLPKRLWAPENKI